MIRRCMTVVDRIEQAVEAWITVITTIVETVCRTVIETIETWERQVQRRCEQVRRQVCTWLPWPLSDLCNWVTETICSLVEVLVKIVKTIVKTVCEVITSIIRSLVRVILSVVLIVMRVICFVVGFILNWVSIIGSFVLGLPEFLSCLLGLKIRKHMHICVTVLAGRDGQPVLSNAEVTRVLREASEIISRRMNVRVHIHGRKVVQVPEERLDVNACDASQLFSSDAIDLSDDASKGGSFSDIFGCGDNVVDAAHNLIHNVLDVIFIRNIVEGDDVGCHIPGTDYVIVDRTASGLVLAHELGHAGDLWHVSAADNLMNHQVAGDSVDAWQVCLFRRSRFVGYAP